MAGKQGFRLRSILIHSLWITILGVFLFRLATANTQGLVYAEIFAVSGTILATAPWIIQLTVSTAIILLYKAEVCDLMWLVSSRSEEHRHCQDNTMIQGGNVIKFCNGSGDEQEVVSGHGSINVGKGSRFPAPFVGRNGPRLQRNRTV